MRNDIHYALEWKTIVNKEVEKINPFTDPSVSAGEIYQFEREYDVE